jgi:hypothetical protein
MKPRAPLAVNVMRHDMSLVDEIKQAWGWVGIKPVEVVGENDFGNLLIKDEEGKYWRLCPENCYCEVIAANRGALDQLSADQAFLSDWYMTALVSLANEKCGPLTVGRKYCLKISGVLGGEYGGDNLASAPQVELVRVSGDIARQIKDLPEGAQVKLQVVE